jgi:hypothetical protein
MELFPAQCDSSTLSGHVSTSYSIAQQIILIKMFIRIAINCMSAMQTDSIVGVCSRGPSHIHFVGNTFWKERYSLHHRDEDAGVVSCTSCFCLHSPDSPDIVDLHDGRHTCLGGLDLLVPDITDAGAIS